MPVPYSSRTSQGWAIDWVRLDFDEAPYWLFRVMNVRDVLDAHASQIRYFSDGRRVMCIDRPTFRAEAVSGLFMWQITELPADYVCVSDAAINLVREHGLTGFCFELLWSDKYGALLDGLKNWEKPRFTGLETEPFDFDGFWTRYDHRQTAPVRCVAEGPAAMRL